MGTTSLMLVKLPRGTSCASWQASGHDLGTHALWGIPQVSHADFSLVDGDTKVRVACSGFYLFMVRDVHGGNNRKRLQLLHNSSVIAISHVTTDGSNRHCGHLVEVIHAAAGDLFSVTCEDAEYEEFCSNLSAVLLQRA